MINSSLFSSKTEEWSTPQDFFNLIDKEFKFTLDAAATVENAKCKNFYTIEDNGLEQKWTGVVWCNPPYGRKIYKWIEKAKDSSNDGATVVMLLPARTDTQWFHNLIYKKEEIRFIKGRLKFGDGKGSAPFPSMLVIFRPKHFES